MPDTWRRHATVGQLQCSGLWSLEGMDQGLAGLVARLAQERMDQLPMATDAFLPMGTHPLSGSNYGEVWSSSVPLTGPSGAPILTLESPMGTALSWLCYGPDGIKSASEMGHRFVHEGRMAPTPFPLLHTIRHELCHPVMVQLARLPGTVEWLEGQLTAMHGRPFRFDDGASQSLIAQRLGNYAGMASMHPERSTTSASTTTIVDEFAAEALALAMTYGDNAPGEATIVAALAKAAVADDESSREVAAHLYDVNRAVRCVAAMQVEAAFKSGEMDEVLAHRLEADPDWLRQLEEPDPFRSQLDEVIRDIVERSQGGSLEEHAAAVLGRASEMVREIGIDTRAQLSAGSVASADVDPGTWSSEEHRWMELARPDPLLVEAARLEGQARGIPAAATELFLDSTGKLGTAIDGTDGRVMPHEPVRARRRIGVGASEPASRPRTDGSAPVSPGPSIADLPGHRREDDDRDVRDGPADVEAGNGSLLQRRGATAARRGVVRKPAGGGLGVS